MKDVDAWDIYWSTGVLESCVAKSDQLVTNALDHFWGALVDQCTHDSQILDLASGNGAVLSIMLNINPELDVTGIDISESCAFADAHKYKRAKFLANVGIENTPFNEASFSAISSQFGLEYALRHPFSENDAIRELSRLLVHGGICQFLIHHSFSELVRTNSLKLAELNLLLANDGLLEGIVGYIEGEITQNDIEQRGREYLNTEVTKSKAISGQVFDVITYFLQQKKTEPLQEKIYLTVSRIKAEQSRLNQLVNAALGKEEMIQLKKAFLKHGISITDCSEFYIPSLSGGSDLLGWKVRGIKR